MIENDDYKISPYFWKCLSGCSRFCHTAAFTVTRAQARMCSATLASTNEGGPCASHDCTVCTFCRSKYMLKLAQTTFNMKTEHIKWVLHARTHTRTHTHTHLHCICDGIENLKNGSFQILQGGIYFHLFIIKSQGHAKERQAVVIVWIKQTDKLLYAGLKQ